MKAFLAALAVAAAAHAQCGLHSFDAPPSSTFGTVVGRADFDGDGQIDIVTANEIHFGGGTRVAALPRSGARIVTDINRDGRPDIAGYTGTELFTLINQGDAAFALKTTAVPKVTDPTSAAYTGDFNGDGIRDILITGVGDPILQTTPVYLTQSDGTFAPEFGVVISSGAPFIIADIDGDGRDDIAVHQPRTRTVINLRQEHGFMAAQLGPLIDGALVAAADFDHDGRGDLVFNVAVQGGVVTTIVYDPMGTPRIVTNIAGSPVLARDFNGDGYADLLIFQKGGQVLLNDRHGGFNQSDWLPGDVFISGAADIDGDGAADLVTPTGFVRGNGDGTFRSPRMAFPATALGVSGDFDGDGDDDVALPNAIVWNDGGNAFHVTAITDPRMIKPVRTADIDGDGKAELFTQLPTAVYVLSVKPDGTLTERGAIGTRAIDLAVGDFTGKHHPELVVLPDTLHNVEIWDIQTGTPRTVAHTEGPAQAVAVADFNGDGKDDVVVVGKIIVLKPGSNPSAELDGFVSTFLSTATALGAERRNIVLTSGQQFDDVAAGDFDGDGKMDAAGLTTRFSDLLLFARGDGSGDLKSFKSYPAGDSSESFRSLQTADLDGDGRADVLLNGVNGIFYGTPNGLERHTAYFGPRSAGALTYQPLLVRPRRGALPWVITPTLSGDVAYAYRPLCEIARPRAVRH